MTVWADTLWAAATWATVWPPLRAVWRSASLMPIAFATTEVSVTASVWPPGPFGSACSVPSVVVDADPDGAVGVGAGDAPREEIAPRVAAPATPPITIDPRLAAVGLAGKRR